MVNVNPFILTANINMGGMNKNVAIYQDNYRKWPFFGKHFNISILKKVKHPFHKALLSFLHWFRPIRLHAVVPLSSWANNPRSYKLKMSSASIYLQKKNIKHKQKIAWFNFYYSKSVVLPVILTAELNTENEKIRLEVHYGCNWYTQVGLLHFQMFIVPSQDMDVKYVA